jgi:GNAT superfamily N-acetyltransferase
VAPLDSEAHRVLAPTNPFFQHARLQLWVAVRDGRDVGRMAAILDDTHNAVQGGRTAHFGFLESVDDPAVTGALFAAVRAWAQAAGCDRVVGPMNPSINDECGLLIAGFAAPPVLMMTYNPPYLPALVEGAGFTKAKDLYAYYVDLAKAPVERLERMAADFRRRYPRVTVRPITQATAAADVPKLQRIYNEAWEKNWGAVPLSDGEIRGLAERLLPLVVEGLVWLAEEGDAVAGFLLAVPDANEIIRPLRGRLLSPGLWRTLPYLAGWRQPRLFRVIALGTRREFRRRGLEAMMFAETLRRARALGFAGCEASWILEDNRPVRRLLEAFSAEPYKTYRIYERPV